MANVTPNILAPDFDRPTAAQPKFRPGNREHTDRFDRFLERPSDDRARDAARADRERDFERADRARESDRAASARETENAERIRESERADRARDDDRTNAERTPAERTGDERTHTERTYDESARDERVAPPSDDRRSAVTETPTDRDDTEDGIDRTASTSTEGLEQVTERADIPANPASVDEIASHADSISVEPAVAAQTVVTSGDAPPETTVDELPSPETDTQNAPLPGHLTTENTDTVPSAPATEDVTAPRLANDGAAADLAELPASDGVPDADVSVPAPDMAPLDNPADAPAIVGEDVTEEPVPLPNTGGQHPLPGPQDTVSTDNTDAPVAHSRPPVPEQALKGLENAASHLPEHYAGNGRPGEIEPPLESSLDVTGPDEVPAGNPALPPDGDPLPIPPVTDGADTEPLPDTPAEPADAVAELPDVAPGVTPGTEETAETTPEREAVITEEAATPLSSPAVDAHPDDAPPQQTGPSSQAQAPVPADDPDILAAPETRPQASGNAIPATPASEVQSAQRPAIAPASSPNTTAAPVLPAAPAKPANQPEPTAEPLLGEEQPETTVAERRPADATIKQPGHQVARSVPATRPGSGLLQQTTFPVRDTIQSSSAPAVDGETPQTPRINPFTQQTGDSRSATAQLQTQAPTPAANPVTAAAGPEGAPAPAETSAPLPEPAIITSSGTATPTSDARTPVLPLPQNTHAVSIQFGTSPFTTSGLQTPVNTIAFNIARNFDNGVTKFQIRIDPPELGRVDVKLDMTVEGRVHAHLTVERSETLDLMMRDARALEKALADTGLNLNKDSLSFSLKDQGNFDADGKMRQQHGAPEDGVDNQTPAEEMDDAVSDAGIRGYISDTGVDISV